MNGRSESEIAQLCRELSDHLEALRVARAIAYNRSVAAEDENAMLREALGHYTDRHWSRVASYSDSFWYLEGHAPWGPAMRALASGSRPECRHGLRECHDHLCAGPEE